MTSTNHRKRRTFDRATASILTNYVERFLEGRDVGVSCVVGSVCYLCDLPTKMAVDELTALEKCLGLRAGKYSSRAQGSSQVSALYGTLRTGDEWLHRTLGSEIGLVIRRKQRKTGARSSCSMHSHSSSPLKGTFLDRG